MTRVTKIVITVVLFISAFTFSHFNTYLDHYPYPVEVTQLYSGAEGKYASLHFVGVFKTKNGVIFDRELSAAFYSQLQVHDKITMDLRPMDVNPTAFDDIFWSFGQCLLVALCIAWVIFLPFINWILED